MDKDAKDFLKGLIDDKSPLNTAQSSIEAPSVFDIIFKHRRHVELSPGAGAAEQAYALAVIDDIEADMRRTPLSATRDTTEERAWLIEMPSARWGTGYCWKGVTEYGTWGTVDEAVRFARKEDAERVIESLHAEDKRLFGYMVGKKYEACEHIWATSDGGASAIGTPMTTGAVYLIDGKPHRPCQCNPYKDTPCPLGRSRTLATAEFTRCSLPVDVLVAK